MAAPRRPATFKGGHYFSRFEGCPASDSGSGSALKALPPPREVILFMRQCGFVRGERAHLWAEAKPCVEPGQAVKVGQVIGRDDDSLCTPVHATIGGTVAAVEERPHPFGGTSVAVVIRAGAEGDGKDKDEDKDEWAPLNAVADYAHLSAEELGRLLYEAGVSGLGGEGFPTPYRSSPAPREGIRHLVINAVETEPYVEAPDALLHQELDKFVTGVQILRRALGEVSVHLGIGYDKPRLIEELEERFPQDWFVIQPLRPKYPQGEDEVLVRTLLDLRVPAGGFPSQVGALVCDVQQAVAAYEAVVEGKAFVQRAVSLGGSAVRSPANVRARIGTPLSELIELDVDGADVVALGGVMRGAAVSVEELSATPLLRDTKAVVALKGPEKSLMTLAEPGFRRDSYTRAFLALPWAKKRAEAGLRGLPRACVKCGYCVDVCPQGLVPIMIGQFAEHDLIEDALELDMLACVECGLCSYVCPSKIPVMSLIRQGKRKYLKMKS